MSIPEDVKDRFQDIIEAVQDGNIILMQSTHAETNDVIYVIGAYRPSENNPQAVDIQPIAEMGSRDPFEYVTPPEGAKIVNENTH